jgi:nitrate/nitrite transport system permease protein
MSENSSASITLPKNAASTLSFPAFSAGMSWLQTKALPPILGLGIFVAVWHVLALLSPGLSGPAATWDAAIELFSKPFYINTPNDQGIGWNVLASLGRVGIGFGLAAMVGIPAGFMLGRWMWLSRLADPVIALLRPVSPLAWLPIGLLILKSANPASIYVIFISSIWPLIINTAAGVRQIPEDYLNLARVLNLSEWKIFTKILLPATIPSMLTGVRLSIGTAWLVIVAAEMLTGGVGLGFWIWDEWNNLNMEHIIIAIFVVGIVGYALEAGLLWLGRRMQYS